MGEKMVNTNEDLNKLAIDVLKNYNINPENISVIQSGTIKTVWKIKTQNELLCLKRLKQPYDKALFSVNAQIFVKNAGGNVPEIILNKDSNPITVHNEQLFVIYEWLKGTDLDFQNATNLKSAIEGLAKFHIYTKGYVSPQDAQVSSKLGKWTNQYTSMKNKFESWKEEAQKHQQPYYASYLKCADSMIEIADLAIGELQKTSYEKFALQESNSVVLCHQDYGKGNAIQTEEGVFVLDLDGVTYDLPARDLRKIIGKYAQNKGSWDEGSIETILKWYTSVNAMDDLEKEILYVDLLFPHWFYGLVKNLFLNNKPLKAFEIEKIAQFEQSKVAVLKKLLKRGV